MSPELREVNERWREAFGEDLPLAMVAEGDIPLLEECLESASKRPLLDYFDRLFESGVTSIG